MPLTPGIHTSGGEMAAEIQQRISVLVKYIDEQISSIANSRNLFSNTVRLLLPCSVAYLEQEGNYFAIISSENVGGIPIRFYSSVSGPPMTLQGAIFLAERDLGFHNAFGFPFTEAILNADENAQRQFALQSTSMYINSEVMRVERMNKIVRLNPIFQGREFLIDESLVFVLSPFKEPYNSLYKDHIKLVVEAMPGMKCERADSIFDNKPIIEDVWRRINEARLLVADLTERNPNVFYEVGVAHTVGKEVILITQTMDDVPFDLKHLRSIVYDNTYQGAITFRTNLKNTIETILAR